MINIRKTIASDAEQISELIYSLMYLFLAEPSGKGAEHFLQMSTPAGLAAFMAQPNVNYLLGEDDGVFCGVIAVRNNSHLQHLYVAPSFQGRGVGKYLWQTARDQAVAAGSAGEFTVNASLNAVSFYKRMGFEVVGDVLLIGGLRFQPMKLIQAHNKRVNAAAALTGIDWMLQQPLQTGGEVGMSSVSTLQERIKDD